jgi:hypothetical protein
MGTGVEAILWENPNSIDFNEVRYDDVSSLNLSSYANAIGYGWKAFALTSEFYSIYQNNIYIVKSRDGLLYKLKFIKFYNEDGARGYPEFEFQQL